MYLVHFVQIYLLIVPTKTYRSFDFPINENNECIIPSNGVQGTCVNIRDCSTALNDLKNRIQPTTCYFIRNDQFVCCPTSVNFLQQLKPELSLNRLRESKSEKKCQEVIKNAELASKFKMKNTFHIAVVGGENTDVGEFPYMAAIGWKRDNDRIDYLCGGALISENFILTAAHCTNLEGKSPVVVRVGGANLGRDDTPTNISKIHIHPSYKISEQYNDIALIEIPKIVGQITACLWTRNSLDSQNELTAIGYGVTEFAGTHSDELQKVNLTVYSNQRCSGYYPPGRKIKNSIIESQLCAGDPKGEKDTCQGDSGGPLLFKVPVGVETVTYIVGITSFGQICATSAPSVYTRVSSYIDWIESIVWP